MILLVSLMIFLILSGTRIAYAIAISALIYILIYTDISSLVIVQQISAGADSQVLLAIPFFLLAGELMNQAGITKRLVRFSLALLGRVRGGLTFVVVISNIIMSMVSGAAIASAAAVGTMMVPEMKDKGYPEGFSGAVNAASATIGPIIPPSIGFIIYASLSGASVGKLFIAGALPGIVLGISLMIICYWISANKNFPRGEKLNAQELWESFKDAIWSLFMPIIILGGIIGGFVTVTEAGVLAVVYGLIIGLFIHGDIKIKNLSQLFAKAAKQTAIIMIVMACAAAFGFLISREISTEYFIELFQVFYGNTWLLLIILILVIIALGTVMEGGSIMIILTPVLLPILQTFGIDIIHFGVIFQLAIMIGLLTPPIGILLFVISGASNVPVKDILSSLWPFYIVIFIVLLLVAFIPELSLWLIEVLGESVR